MYYRPEDEAARTEAPEFLYVPVETLVFIPYCSGNIRMIDFGEAFFANKSTPHGPGTPYSICSPEYLRGSKYEKASDIWALACLIYTLRFGNAMFGYVSGGAPEWLQDIEYVVGDVPFRRGEVTDQVAAEMTGGVTLNGLSISAAEPTPNTAESDAKEASGVDESANKDINKDINKIINKDIDKDIDKNTNKDTNKDSKNQKEKVSFLRGKIDAIETRREGSVIPKRESDLVYDFLRKGLDFDPKKRWTAAQPLQHEWMSFDDSEIV